MREEMDNLIGKIIKDGMTGDIGKVIKREGYYYLIKWMLVEKDSHHYEENKREYYAKYSERNLKESGRFEFITGAEALVYMI